MAAWDRSWKSCGPGNRSSVDGLDRDEVIGLLAVAVNAVETCYETRHATTAHLQHAIVKREASNRLS